MDETKNNEKANSEAAVDSKKEQPAADEQKSSSKKSNKYAIMIQSEKANSEAAVDLKKEQPEAEKTKSNEKANSGAAVDLKKEQQTTEERKKKLKLKPLKVIAQQVKNKEECTSSEYDKPIILFICFIVAVCILPFLTNFSVTTEPNGLIKTVWYNETYTVQEGDTIEFIAAAHGVDWHDLAVANDIPIVYNDDGTETVYIYVGQELKIPEKISNAEKPTKKDSNSNSKPGTQGTKRTHTVKAGESISSIAAAYGISDWHRIVDVNDDLYIFYDDWGCENVLVYEGQVINIPG